jgi:outer membrane protein TolC
MASSKPIRYAGSTSGLWFLALLLIGVVMFSGCVVGPKYNRPSVDAPSAWKEPPPEGWKAATPHDEISKGNWWAVFDDPELNDLETQARDRAGHAVQFVSLCLRRVFAGPRANFRNSAPASWFGRRRRFLG